MPERFFGGQNVYYFSATKGWTRGKLAAMNREFIEVCDEESQLVEKVNNTELMHGFMENAYDANDPELFKIYDLHVATVLSCLKERYEKLGFQYSKMGEMVISVNPFQQKTYNGEAERLKYLNAKDPLTLQPHLWQIAHKAFIQIVIRGGGNQSVLISGESGSGKTENTKNLIAYLGQLSFRYSCNATQKAIADLVADRLFWSNTILESFGNARTVRNDNSSRFGKYIKLFFDTKSGVMVGGEMVTYLLEKSRVINVGLGERNYHIFYEMLEGLTAQQKADLGGLRSAKQYKCLNKGNEVTRRGIDGRFVDDGREFKNVLKAFTRMGMSSENQEAVIKTLASILHLQDVEFDVDANDKAKISDAAPLNKACQLLGIDPRLLRLCFLEKSRTKILTTLANKNEAEGLRDAFCKSIYVGLFDSLVAIVNAAIKPRTTLTGAKYIGVLDIFGFENFQFNSFEQLCINYANEALQNHYNKFIFLNDEEESKAEGIPFPKIEFPDNQPTLNMFDQAKVGIFASLDEETFFKGGTSDRFTSNIWNTWTGRCLTFLRPKGTVPIEFGVRHYASDVLYNTQEWLEKNIDALKDEAKQVIQQSSNPFIRTLLDGAETVNSDGIQRRKVTVSSRFQKQLIALRQELESTETHFIRCIKPNMLAVPGKLDNLYVGTQLESAGVIQTIGLKRQGYPTRRLHKDFSTFFLPIASRQLVEAHKQGRFREVCEGVLGTYQKLYSWKSPHYAIGKTKVFCAATIWSRLERLVIRKKRYCVLRCVPYLQRWIARFRAKKAAEEKRRREEQLRLQAEAMKREQLMKQQEAFSMIQRGQQGGLDSTRAQWFDALARAFPYFDLPVLLDVARTAPSIVTAVSAMNEMQAQRLDSTLPSSLRLLFNEVGMRPVVVEKLTSMGVVSVHRVSELSQKQLKDVGMNDREIVALNSRMMSMPSDLITNEHLRASVGDANLHDMQIQLKAFVVSNKQDHNLKLRRLMDMGYTLEQADDALKLCKGDFRIAAQVLVSGGGQAVVGPRGPAILVRREQPKTGKPTLQRFGSNSGAAHMATSTAVAENKRIPQRPAGEPTGQTQRLSLQRSSF